LKSASQLTFSEATEISFTVQFYRKTTKISFSFFRGCQL